MPAAVSTILWIVFALCAIAWVVYLFVKFHKKQKGSFNELHSSLDVEYLKQRFEADKDRYDCDIIDKDGKKRTIELRGESEEAVIRQIKEDLGGKIISIKKRVT